MSGSERHTHVGHRYLWENEESEQHSFQECILLKIMDFMESSMNKD